MLEFSWFGLSIRIEFNRKTKIMDDDETTLDEILNDKTARESFYRYSGGSNSHKITVNHRDVEVVSCDYPPTFQDTFGGRFRRALWGD